MVEKIYLILKSGFKFEGVLLKETADSLTIDDIRSGETQIDKSFIAVRGVKKVLSRGV